MRELIVIVCAAVSSTGCGAGVKEQFGPTGFRHFDYPYEVAYVEGGNGLLLSDDWRLDNFQMRDGQLHDYKDGEEYVYTAEFDTDDDGTVDYELDLYTYDLLFEHRRHNGRIWLRSFPVAEHVGEKSLEVLGENYVARVSGSGFMVSRLDDVVLEERRYGTRLVDSASGHVAGAPAHRVTFDVVNLDQQEADPDTVPTRVRIYLIRPDYPWVWGAGTGRGTISRHGTWPMIMVAGYANDATRFDGGLPAFESFVSRIAFLQEGGAASRGMSGFEPEPEPEREGRDVEPEVAAPSANPTAESVPVDHPSNAGGEPEEGAGGSDEPAEAQSEPVEATGE